MRGTKIWLYRRPINGRLSQTKIEDFRVPAPRHKNICRLDVPVHDSFGMSCIESISDFDGKGQCHIEVHRPSLDGVLQCRSIKELHYDEGLPVLLANVVNGADVGMIQGRGGGSIGRCLGGDHSPGLSTAAHFVFASACVPTDDGAATTTADPVAPWKVTRSPESDFLQLQNQIRI